MVNICRFLCIGLYLCCYMSRYCWFIISHYYVLLNTRLRLVLLDHVTCDFLWQYNLWWNHYWLCDGYDLAILIPSKTKIVAFIAWISKSTLFLFVCWILCRVDVSINILILQRPKHAHTQTNKIKKNPTSYIYNNQPTRATTRTFDLTTTYV